MAGQSLVIATNAQTPSALWAILGDNQVQFIDDELTLDSLLDPRVRAANALANISPPSNALVLQVVFSPNGNGKLVQPDVSSSVLVQCDPTALCSGTRPPPDPVSHDKTVFMVARRSDVLEGGLPIAFFPSEEDAKQGASSTQPGAGQIFWLLQVKGTWSRFLDGTLVPMSDPDLVGSYLTIPVHDAPEVSAPPA